LAQRVLHSPGLPFAHVAVHNVDFFPNESLVMTNFHSKIKAQKGAIEHLFYVQHKSVVKTNGHNCHYKVMAPDYQ